MTASSQIQRSWKSTFISLGVALGCAALAVPLWMYLVEGPVTAGIALLPTILALIFLYSAIALSGTGVCPLCGKTMEGLSVGRPTLCGSCLKYIDTKDRTLTPTDESTVAEDPAFSAKLPKEFTFPDSCCVCGKAATHREKVQTRAMNASSAVTNPTLGLTTTTTFTVEVPHCDDHKGGALLSGNSSSMVIRFRSYPYLRQFCEANHTTPG